MQIVILPIILILTVVFNMGLIDIRFEEINYLLGKVAFDKEASNAVGILAKYELIKRRMKYGEDNTDTYELEARILAITSGDQFSSSEENIYIKKKYLIPIRIFLNSIRFLLGKEFINPKEDNKIFKVIEIGYFWERNRKYSEAVTIYDDILAMSDLSDDIRSIVLIHKAFCHSMMSEYDEAKKLYELVINLYPKTEPGVLSWKLLEFIQSIEDKREVVKKKNLSDFEKAKQYYLLMDYRNSIKYFSIFLQDNDDNKKFPEARYFKGRSHEELGESDEAVMEYRYTMKIDKNIIWARESNRRMLMLGEFYNYQSKMASEAKKQLAAYKDDSFIGAVDKYQSMLSEGSVRKELMAKYGNKNENDNDAMNLLDDIDNLELGEVKNESEISSRTIKNRREKLIEGGTQSPKEIRELARKKALAGNPFRRPSYIQRTIDGNANQLKYIYNKKLRKGIKLSGKMLVEIDILSNGKISSTKILTSNIGDSQFEKDVLKKISTWRFRKVTDSLGSLSIRYPFEFNEE